MEEPETPNAPGPFTTEQYLSSEIIARKVEDLVENDEGKMVVSEKIVKQQIYKCTVQITWTTPLSNGAMIEGYELRYRPALLDNSSLTSNKGWRTENKPHRRTRHDQGIMLEGLRTSCKYQMMARARNQAGYGKWSPVESIYTVASPTEDTSGNQQDQD